MYMRGVYRKIARQYGITVKEAKEEMQTAIDRAWMIQEKTVEQATAQSNIPSKGDIPTPDEFIRYLSRSMMNNH